MAKLAKLGVLVAPLFLARVASAQDAAAADAQFQRGVAAMQKGDLETACPAIAESQRLDPRPGTLFTLAECEAKRGRVATATQHYADYLAQTERLKGADRQRHEERRGMATKKHAELSAKIPKLTLTLPAGATDVEVRRDGTLLGPASLGVALPVDPGERKVVVRTKDGREATQTIRVAEGESKPVTLELPAAATAVPPPKSSEPPPAAIGPAPPKKSSTGAWIAGGVGVAGLVVSGVTGVMVFGKKGTISDHCVDGRCDREGKQAADSAKSLATVSTVAFGVGVIGVGVSAWLFSTGSKKEEPSVALGVAPLPRGASVGASGRF